MARLRSSPLLPCSAPNATSTWRRLVAPEVGGRRPSARARPSTAHRPWHASIRGLGGAIVGDGGGHQDDVGIGRESASRSRSAAVGVWTTSTPAGAATRGLPRAASPRAAPPSRASTSPSGRTIGCRRTGRCRAALGYLPPLRARAFRSSAPRAFARSSSTRATIVSGWPCAPPRPRPRRARRARATISTPRAQRSRRSPRPRGARHMRVVHGRRDERGPRGERGLREHVVGEAVCELRQRVRRQRARRREVRSRRCGYGPGRRVPACERVERLGATNRSAPGVGSGSTSWPA